MLRRYIGVFRKLFMGDFFKTLYINYLMKNPNMGVIIYPKVKVYIDNLAKLIINESSTVKVGINWNKTTFYSSTLNLASNATLVIRGDFNFYSGIFVSISSNAVLDIGSGYINSNSEISCFKSIKIGNNVAISKGVCIRDSDNHFIKGREENCTLPIEIGDNVWIGLNATILKGVKIGSGTVIAAGAVVCNDIPGNCLAGGVPAKVIKTNVEWY